MHDVTRKTTPLNRVIKRGRKEELSKNSLHPFSLSCIFFPLPFLHHHLASVFLISLFCLSSSCFFSFVFCSSSLLSCSFQSIYLITSCNFFIFFHHFILFHSLFSFIILFCSCLISFPFSVFSSLLFTSFYPLPFPIVLLLLPLSYFSLCCISSSQSTFFFLISPSPYHLLFLISKHPSPSLLPSSSLAHCPINPPPSPLPLPPPPTYHCPGKSIVCRSTNSENRQTLTPTMFILDHFCIFICWQSAAHIRRHSLWEPPELLVRDSDPY